MASITNGSNGNSNHREFAIAAALAQKRKQIDLEIHQFYKLKEQEFRAFEHELRLFKGIPLFENAEEKIQHLKWRLKKPKVAQHGRESGKSRGTVRGKRGGISGGDDLESRGEEEIGHDREKEFQGVFTPRYLPLLGEKGEGTGEDKLSNQAEENMQFPIRETEGQNRLPSDETSLPINEPFTHRLRAEIASARRSSAPLPHLSSSAEDHPPALTSPPPTPAVLSSSVPPEHNALNQRRSSNRSDVSIERLRSSLKNKDQPKSPKRVQFSLGEGEGVVSPGSSPLSKREGNSGRGRPGKSDAREKFEVLLGQSNGKSSENGPSSEDFDTTKRLLRGPNPLSSGFGDFFRSSTKQAESLTTMAGGGGEDFDILDHEDDVFSFDEDVSNRWARERKNAREGKVIDEDDIDEGGGEVGEVIKMGSSPHAGSLPIEIKWPMKRDPRS